MKTAMIELVHLVIGIVKRIQYLEKQSSSPLQLQIIKVLQALNDLETIIYNDFV